MSRRILTIKNAKLSGYYFYANLNIWGDFQICISVPLTSSQKQTVIKMLLKKDKDKRFIKIISKVLSTRIKNVLPFLITSSQTAYVKNRFISESGRLISDILEISNSLALEGFLVTVDIEKAFDSVNLCFLLQILEKFGFGVDFVNWIETILNK